MIVLDCGKNTSTMYDSNTDTCLTVPHSVLLELPERLDSGSLVVCEYAHLGTPRTKSSRSQPFTADQLLDCLLYTSPSPRDQRGSRMPSSA